MEFLSPKLYSVILLLGETVPHKIKKLFCSSNELNKEKRADNGEERTIEFLGIEFEPSDGTIFRNKFKSLLFACYAIFIFFCTYAATPFVGLLAWRVFVWWPYYLIYGCWYLYDRNSPHNGGYKYCPLRSKLSNYLKWYFPAKLVKTHDLPATANYLLGIFPHGVMVVGLWAHFNADVNCVKTFPGLNVRSVFLSVLFRIPIFREILLSFGHVSSTKESIVSLLNSDKRNALAVVVIGGVAEAELSEPGTNRVVLKNRKGFVKLALQSGAALVPTYTFGENDLYGRWPSDLVKKFYNFTRRYHIPYLPINIIGRGVFQRTYGLVPRRIPLTTVVGKPIPLPKIDDPTQGEIDKYHEMFKNDLKVLFDTHKEKYDMTNGKNAQLEFV